jgi:hypothetical protein
MTKNATEPSEAREEAATTRRRSGTRFVGQEVPGSEGPETMPTLRPDPFRLEVDPDAPPTQPENDAPVRRELVVELPPAGHDDRDTIPSPPPDAN